MGLAEKSEDGWLSESAQQVASAVQESAPEESHEDSQVVADA